MLVLSSHVFVSACNLAVSVLQVAKSSEMDLELCSSNTDIPSAFFTQSKLFVCQCILRRRHFTPAPRISSFPLCRCSTKSSPRKVAISLLEQRLIVQDWSYWRGLLWACNCPGYSCMKSRAHCQRGTHSGMAMNGDMAPDRSSPTLDSEASLIWIKQGAFISSQRRSSEPG